MDQNAIIIGPRRGCERLERQLDLMERRPRTVGWVVVECDAVVDTAPAAPILGGLDDLEQIVARQRPDLALLSLPAVMSECIGRIRTRLRRLGVPDRFIATLEDQVAGVGPRTHLEIDHSHLLARPPRQLDLDAIRSVIAGRRVMITGAGGSIGSHLARISGAFDPAHLTLVDRAENALFEIDRQIARRFPRLPRTALLHDVVDAPATLAHFHRLRPQVIFHAAAHKHVPMMEDHPAAAVDNNLFGTRSVADAAAITGASRLVLISTDKAINPASIMGATKRLAELYVQHVNRRHALGCAIVRFGNVLGSSGSVIDTWSREIAEGGPLTVTHPGMTRYFMTVSEAAALVIQSAALLDEGAEAGEVFLLDMGEPVNILELARRFIRLHGLEPVVPGAAAPAAGAAGLRVVFTGPRPGEKLHEELPRPGEDMRPTRHPDINIWMLPPPPDRYIEEVLEALAPGRRPADAAAVARLVRALVPGMAVPVAA
jgi:FlaA1/EpsC-like NDP-sugar epimerase